MRDRAKNIVESKAFENFILTVIVINSVAIGIQTAKPGGALSWGLAMFD